MAKKKKSQLKKTPETKAITFWCPVYLINLYNKLPIELSIRYKNQTDFITKSIIHELENIGILEKPGLKKKEANENVAGTKSKIESKSENSEKGKSEMD